MLGGSILLDSTLIKVIRILTSWQVGAYLQYVQIPSQLYGVMYW